MFSEKKAEAGFSLIELTIAMVITLLVTGAIYGLLSGGQNAFKVQPERTDRQQNIRTAMDLIMRDIASAGQEMPPFVQVFTPGLDGVGVPLSPSGGQTDELEMVTNPQNYPSEPVCGGLAQFQRGVSVLPTPPPAHGVIVLTTDVPPQWAALKVTGITSVAPAPPCAGANRPQLAFATACNASGFGNITGACTIASITFGEVVRYRIRNGVDGIPNLERSTTGDFAGFQVVARGVEDLQVQYLNNAACTTVAPCPNAPSVTPSSPIVPADYNKLVTQVRVLLSSRSTVRTGQIQGQSNSATTTAMRGQLVSTGSPRAALWAVNANQNPPVWH